MNTKKHLALFVCVVLVITFCCGCTSLLQQAENPQIRQHTTTMIDALIANDLDSAYDLVSNLTTKAEFAQVFAKMEAFLSDANTYELTMLSINVSSKLSGGQNTQTTSVVYKMVTDTDQTVIVSILTRGQDHVLQSFYLTPYELTDYYYTGTIDKMQKASIGQWLLLLSNLLSIGIAVFAVVDCARRPIKKKALWIAAIVLGFIALGATIGTNGFRFNFNFGWITAYTCLIRYGTGTVALRLMLPLGAIAYFLSRLFARRSGTTATADTALPETEQPATCVEAETAVNEDTPAAD